MSVERYDVSSACDADEETAAGVLAITKDMARMLSIPIGATRVRYVIV